uniref:Coiled-coil domain containing 112 n=1 Tax=Oryzias sinensis TaxID=183150 RepID=A0A8C7XXB5_9TELE
MSHLTLEELKDLGHQIPYFLVFFTCVSNANQQHFAHEALSSGVSLQKQLMKIQKDVRKFQHHLIDVKPTPECKFGFSFPKNNNKKLKLNDKKCIKLHNRDLPAEVRAPEDFLQKTGGPYGGWDQCDHQVFLRIWTKHRGQTSYRNEAKLHLPDKTAEEIKRHECWHLELLSLQEKKKKVRNAECVQRKHFKSPKSNISVFTVLLSESCCRTTEERKEVARQLEKWREEKRRKEEQEEEQRVAKEIQRRKLEEVLFLVFASVCHQEPQSKFSFYEKNTMRLLFILQVNEHISRDPSRLIRPTKGWQERMKHIGPSGGGPLLQMFHRAVPTWRQGL